MPNDPQVSIRLPQALLDRAEQLIPVMNALPKYEGVLLTRADVLRIALTKGMTALEAQTADAPGEGGGLAALGQELSRALPAKRTGEKPAAAEKRTPAAKKGGRR